MESEEQEEEVDGKNIAHRMKNNNVELQGDELSEVFYFENFLHENFD